jgi:hypothetical protein
MYSKPWFIGIASIVPGLGFLLLKQPWKALKAFLSVAIALVISYALYRSTNIPWIKEYCWNIALIAWFVQSASAVNAAGLLNRQGKGNLVTAKETDRKILPNSILGIGRKGRIREIASQQLEQGETLVAMTIARKTVTQEHSWGSVRDPFQFDYVVLTNKAVLVMEIDFEDMPVNIERIGLDKIQYADHIKGIVNDELYFVLSDNTEREFSVHVKSRREAQEIVNWLDQRKADVV